MFWQEADVSPYQHGDNENESLQTDIQRFMAIMGFCLMAVFALVQAIPVTDPEKDTVIEDLRHDAALQETGLEHLKSENERLNNELARLMHYKGIVESRQKELDQARQELARQSEKIERLTGEKITQQEDLLHYKTLLSKRGEEIMALVAAQERVRQIIEKAAEKTKTPSGPEKKPEMKDKEPVKEKGLYVAFESDRVFLDLLSSGKISLFINVVGMKRGFQVVKKEGRIGFTAGAPGGNLDLWEVKKNMVPFEILEAFKAWTTLSSREKMLIVGLIPEVSRQIRGKKVSSGRFIIRNGGRVSFSPGGE